jgi:hypothetical protein
MGYKKHAYKVFEMCRDLANEAENWGLLMVAYENISITLREDTRYEEALMAAKNML